MSKRTISILYVTGMIIWAGAMIGFFSVIGNYTIASAQWTDAQNQLAQDLNQNVSQDQSNNDVQVMNSDFDHMISAENQVMVSVAFMILASILGMIGWIGTLVNLSRAQAWSLFILTFFFGGIMLLIYLISGPLPLKAGQHPQASARPGSVAPGSYPAIPPQLSGPQAYQPTPPPSSASEILQQRYARGEIDAETYRQMLATLTNSPANPPRQF